jgi:hypothetical protein
MRGWYLEKYDAEGARVFAEDGHTFGTVEAATKSWRPGGHGAVRFIAPVETPQAEIDALKALGAKPT